MKKLILILIAIVLNSSLFSQTLFYAMIDFESSSPILEIDTSQQSNIWQIARPQKLLFDSAYSAPFSIITDSINYYPINNTSSFQIKVVSNNPNGTSRWGNGALFFTHKYDFENGKEGGYIEVKYDDDTTWTNIVLDTDPDLGTSSYDFYSPTDTLLGGIPAFTGTNNTWHISGFSWYWCSSIKTMPHDSMVIRFTVISDSVNTNQEGWVIDNIGFRILDCGSYIDNIESSTVISSVVPNPVSDKSILKFENEQMKMSVISIYDICGRLIKSLSVADDKVEIRNNEFKDGAYTYSISQEEITIGVGKFLVVGH